MRLRVLLAAFDGLQPTQVSPSTTPTIHGLAARGVTFARHQAVFPTVTRVNAASLMTGRYPGGHGLLGNSMVFPELDRFRPRPVLEPDLRQLSAATGGRVLMAPTLGELLAPAGLRFGSVVGGTSGNAYVQHPRAERVGGAVLHADFSLPGHHHPALLSRLGPWPAKEAPALGRIVHTGDAFLEYLLPVVDPDVALVWFPEPDTSQHVSGVDSPWARQTLAAADAQLGRILAGLARAGVEPDVLVVSDHGYSTIASPVDVEAAVRAAGFPPGPEPGGVAVATNGGAALFYVPGGDPAVVERLGEWLSGQPWAGAVLEGRPGARDDGLLPGSLAGVAGHRPADLVMSFRWDSGPGGHGTTGRSDAADGHPGQGTHGSGSPHELRCTLVAAGPRFREGLTSRRPSGQVDLAPTVLRLLGLDGGDALDGRPLLEGLRSGGPPPEDGEPPIEVVERRWRGSVQRLRYQAVGSTRYLRELSRDRGG